MHYIALIIGKETPYGTWRKVLGFLSCLVSVGGLCCFLGRAIPSGQPYRLILRLHSIPAIFLFLCTIVTCPRPAATVK